MVFVQLVPLMIVKHAFSYIIVLVHSIGFLKRKVVKVEAIFYSYLLHSFKECVLAMHTLKSEIYLPKMYKAFLTSKRLAISSYLFYLFRLSMNTLRLSP